MKESLFPIPENVKRLLTEGLIAGYAGSTKREVVQRGGQAFSLESSHFETEDGNQFYHDEWLADRTGGGQELIDIFPSRDRWTRLYAGGVVKNLEAIGLTKKDVTRQLKKFLQELGDKTRLDEDCPLQKDGKWIYEYSIVHRWPVIPITAGIETIHVSVPYKGKKVEGFPEGSMTEKLVFVHAILLCPVE